MPLETLLAVGAIVVVFFVFMAVLMWCDAHSRSERRPPDNVPQK
jgi:hypothetical protein